LAVYSSLPFASGFWFSLTALYLSAYAHKTVHGAWRAIALIVVITGCVALAASFVGMNAILFLYLVKRPIPKMFVPTPWKGVDQLTMPERPEDIKRLDPLP
jgi:hypothetical protein